MSSNDQVGAVGLKPQDFESIREAVMETQRGRWFLNEFASRLRSSETVGLLDSMKRLETAVSSNHDAMMSRLAEALTRETASASPSAPQSDLAPKHMKFFKQDEEIFEPAPQARIAAVPDIAKPPPKPESPKGARVVIRRANEVDTTTIQPEAVTASGPAAASADPSPGVQSASQPVPAPDIARGVLPDPPPEALVSTLPEPTEAPSKRRIVIIRHKPGENIDVPLQKEMAAAG